MTDTKTYDVRGAEVIITATVLIHYVAVHITVDLSNLDQDEPDHSDHNLMNYFSLSNYKRGGSHWWCKTHRHIRVKTGSQANRVVKNALGKIDDAIAKALCDRDRRKAEMLYVFHQV